MTRAERRARAVQMRAMYEAGASLPEIGAKFGVTGEGVRLAILRVGGKMRSRSEAGRAKWQDPDFRERTSEAARAKWRNSELAARQSERIRRLHADPEFAAKNAERMRRLHADPAFNPLVALTESERADYDVLKKAGYTRAEALRAIGRADLIGESEAA